VRRLDHFRKMVSRPLWGLALGAVLMPALAVAQTPAGAKAKAQAPGAVEGHLAGVWDMDHRSYRSSTRFSARERVAVDINGKGPPLLPWAAELLEKRLKQADDEGKIFANNASKCLPQGLPYLLFAAVDGPIQIIESESQVTVLSTEMNEVWIIYLGAQHPKNVDPNYHGDSVGRWEGDTLVIDTIGIAADKTTVDQVGTPHSDALHVVTRLRRTGPDDLDVRVLLDDPKTFTHPWERSVKYHRAAPGTRLEEYVCENLGNAPDANGFQGFHAPAG
jgi:hypothetical protein